MKSHVPFFGPRASLKGRLVTVAAGIALFAFAFNLCGAGSTGPSNEAWYALSDKQMRQISGTATCCSGTDVMDDCDKTWDDECLRCVGSADGQGPAGACQHPNGKLWYGATYEFAPIAVDGGWWNNTGTIVCHTTWQCTSSNWMEGFTCGQGRYCIVVFDPDQWCAQCQRTGTGANPAVKNTSRCTNMGSCPAY